MRLKSCQFHNFGPFSDFNLDLESLGDDKKLVALVGRNGSGKSCAIETAIAGAAYRKMPTNGSLVKRATARDSWVESRLHYGQGWTIRHLVDAVSGKGESVVLSESGAPAFADTKVSSFDQWSERHMPDSDVLFSSVFAAQQSEGFVQMTSAERIDVILSVIGVARLERMAKAARDRQAKASTELKAVVARIAAARGDTATVEVAEQLLIEATYDAENADLQLSKARQFVESTESEARRVAELVTIYDASVTRRAELATALEAAQKSVTDLSTRIANNRAVQEQGDAIRSARAELEALGKTDAQLAVELAAVGKPFDEAAAALVSELAAQQALVVVAESELRAADAKLEAAKAAVRAETERAMRARGRLTDEAAVAGAEAEAHRIGWLVAEATAEVKAAEAALEEQRMLTTATDAARFTHMRNGFGIIRDLDPDRATVAEASGIAVTVLKNDDADLALRVEVPVRISELEGRLARARADLSKQQAALSAAERLAARAPEMEAAGTELANATNAERLAATNRDLLADDRETATVALGFLLDARQKLVERQAQEQARRAELEPPLVSALHEKQNAVADRRLGLEPVAARYDRLIAADARLAELEPQLTAAEAEVSRLEALVSATPVPDAPPPAPDVAAFRQSVVDWEAKARATHGAAAVATQRLADARAVDGRLLALEAERGALEADLADWARLALDLGRTGLQSAEVDSAGPELTELVNDLLRSCHGPRFTVSVDTQRLDSTGHKMLDECRIQVIDSVMGTEKEIREHSGGERALLGTAVSLALTMLACRRAGFDRPTIVRDESGANLDVENAPAWIAMLRRAVEVTGADRLVFVDHRPEIIAMADAVIEIPSRSEAAPTSKARLESAA